MGLREIKSEGAEKVCGLCQDFGKRGAARPALEGKHN